MSCPLQSSSMPTMSSVEPAREQRPCLCNAVGVTKAGGEHLAQRGETVVSLQMKQRFMFERIESRHAAAVRGARTRNRGRRCSLRLSARQPR